MSLIGCNAKSTKKTPSSEDQTEVIAEEVVVQPDESSISVEMPGKTDFIAEGQSPEGGTVLGSPAFDMFIKIEGVDGESADSAHKGWIEILSFSHGVSQPASGLT